MELSSRFTNQITLRLKKRLKSQELTQVDLLLSSYQQRTCVREDTSFGGWLDQEMEVRSNMLNLSSRYTQAALNHLSRLFKMVTIQAISREDRVLNNQIETIKEMRNFKKTGEMIEEVLGINNRIIEKFWIAVSHQ